MEAKGSKIKRVLKKTTKKVSSKKNKKKTTKKKRPSKKLTKKESLSKKTKKVKTTIKKKVVTKTVSKESKAKDKVKIKKEIRTRSYPPTPVRVLPKEYGEDAIALMTVEPRKLFIYWEVSKDTLLLHRGDIGLRLYDVTGIDFDGGNAHSYIDLILYKRIGDIYMNVHPEREYIADIGIKDHTGAFTTIARSNRVSTPPEGKAERGILHPRIYKVGIPIKDIKLGY
ncbi:MAG: DUF4912 domain-containing protein [Thermodesulfovibrionales bacterium]